jgi:hypothetical protein
MVAMAALAATTKHNVGRYQCNGQAGFTGSARLFLQRSTRAAHTRQLALHLA